MKQSSKLSKEEYELFLEMSEWFKRKKNKKLLKKLQKNEEIPGLITKTDKYDIFKETFKI